MWKSKISNDAKIQLAIWSLAKTDQMLQDLLSIFLNSKKKSHLSKLIVSC